MRIALSRRSLTRVMLVLMAFAALSLANAIRPYTSPPRPSDAREDDADVYTPRPNLVEDELYVKGAEDDADVYRPINYPAQDVPEGHVEDGVRSESSSEATGSTGVSHDTSTPDANDFQSTNRPKEPDGWNTTLVVAVSVIPTIAVIGTALALYFYRKKRQQLDKRGHFDGKCPTTCCSVFPYGQGPRVNDAKEQHELDDLNKSPEV